MNSISKNAKKPTQVGKPEVGPVAMNSGRIFAVTERCVSSVKFDRDLHDERLRERKRLARLQARALKTGFVLTTCLTGFVVTGRGIRRYCGDLGIVARALGEIGEVSHG